MIQKQWHRRWIRVLLALICLVCLISPMTAKAANEKVTALPLMDQDESCNILVIGNSFGRDTQEFMGKVAEAAGYKNVAVGLMEIKGIGLYQMWKKVESGKKAFAYRVMTDSKNKGFKRVTARYIFNDRPWDVVILQPQSYSHAGGVEAFYRKASDNTALKVYRSDMKKNRRENKASQPEETEEETSQVESAPVMESESSEETRDDESLPDEPLAEDISKEETSRENIRPWRETASGEATLNEMGTEEEYLQENTEWTEEEETGLHDSVTELSQELSSQYKEELTEEDEEITGVKNSQEAAGKEAEVTSKATKEKKEKSSDKVCVLDIWADYIRAYNPDAKVGLEMTWSYPEGSNVPQFKRFGYSQMKMYRKVAAVTKKLMEKSSMDFMVPVGTAVQNARSSYMGDRLNRDRRHLTNSSGRVISAMCAARSAGLNLSAITEVKRTKELFSSLNLPVILQSVRDAIKKPYKVTSQQTWCPELEKPVIRILSLPEMNLVRWELVEGATAYNLYRKKGNGDYKKIAVIKKDKNFYMDKEIKKKASYTYQLQAVGDDLIASVKSRAVTAD